MRLFTALPLPDPARDAIAGMLDQLRRCDWPVRWVRRDGLHVTLKFYGEVAPERLEVIEESVRFAARGAPPIPLRVTDLGAFPNRSRARVLWVGLEAPSALELLQDRLERSGEEIGFPPEGAPFHAHVTLGRVREGHRLPSRAVEEFQGMVERVPFLAEQLVLYESLLTPEGPRYVPRLTLPLTV
jgi:2'-5' RNA ligase